MQKESVMSWKEDLPEFREKTEQFYRGEINKNEYKGFSGRYGSYAQRGGKASMLRLRMAGGRITKEKLKFIADSIKAHGVNKAHFTTCQTVQFHNLQPESVFDLMEKALDCGIVTMGGGGDFPRNVMVSPLSGVEQGEYFDVLPYAEAAGEFLMTLINGPKMPRKLKVAFSNSPANVTHATYRDLGFVARPDGCFDVYSAGGLGNNPKFGLLVAEKVEPQKILYYIKAMHETFLAHGNYEQRGRARTRYMQDKLGEEGYVKAYQEKLAEVLATCKDLDIAPEIPEVTKTGDGTVPSGKRVIAQKQGGLYTVAYHPLGGCPQPEKFGQLYETICDMDLVEIRVAPDEGIYIINLTGQEAEKVLAVTEDGAQTLFETSISCIGASICQVGVRDSQGLLWKCIGAVRQAQIPDGALPQIHISGCPSSCGTHQTGEIGFHGTVKMIDGVAHPAFMLHLGGKDRQGEEKMGIQEGLILEEDIPAFLIELGRKVAASGLSYAEWEAGHQQELLTLAETYLVK